MADHGDIGGDTVRGTYDAAAAALDDLERLGIGYVEVVELLEREGLAKFEKSWEELLQTVRTELASAGRA